MKAFFYSLTVGIGTFLISYGISTHLDQTPPPEIAPPPTLEGLNASPIDVHKMKGFRRGMGLEN